MVARCRRRACCSFPCILGNFSVAGQIILARRILGCAQEQCSVGAMGDSLQSGNSEWLKDMIGRGEVTDESLCWVTGGLDEPNLIIFLQWMLVCIIAKFFSW